MRVERVFHLSPSPRPSPSDPINSQRVRAPRPRKNSKMFAVNDETWHLSGREGWRIHFLLFFSSILSPGFTSFGFFILSFFLSFYEKGRIVFEILLSILIPFCDLFDLCRYIWSNLLMIIIINSIKIYDIV